MAGGNLSGSHFGHEYYTKNVSKIFFSIVIVMFACWTPSLILKPYLDKTFRKMVGGDNKPALVSVMNGAFTTLVTFIGWKNLVDKKDTKKAWSNSTLCGLLVAELTVYGNSGYIPGLSMVGFFFLMFFSALEESDHNVFNAIKPFAKKSEHFSEDADEEIEEFCVRFDEDAALKQQ